MINQNKRNKKPNFNTILSHTTSRIEPFNHEICDSNTQISSINIVKHFNATMNYDKVDASETLAKIDEQNHEM